MRVNVENTALNRSKKLAKKLNISHPEALGRLVLLWHYSQDEECVIASSSEISFWFDENDFFEKNDVVLALVECGFIQSEENEEDSFEIKGNERHVKRLKELRGYSKKGGRSTKQKHSKKGEGLNGGLKASLKDGLKDGLQASLKTGPIQYNTIQYNATQHSAAQHNTTQGSKNTVQKPSSDTIRSIKVKTDETWREYTEAYSARYGTEPIRNATVNSQMLNFVKRVGEDNAPEVARFYLSHNDAFYIKKQHSVGCLLNDAEGLYTQFISRGRVTSSDARESEKVSTLVEQIERIKRGDL